MTLYNKQQLGFLLGCVQASGSGLFSRPNFSTNLKPRRQARNKRQRKKERESERQLKMQMQKEAKYRHLMISSYHLF